MPTRPIITIAAELRDKASEICLGVVRADVQVRPRDDALWTRVDELAAAAKSRIGTMEKLVAVPQIDAARRVFRACGKKPQRYRVSSEALIRRTLQGKPLYQINNVVDANNLVSLHSVHSVGSYDLAGSSGELQMRIGAAGETYVAIGKQQTEVSGLPVLADDKGPLGSPWSDSLRTMITEDTTTLLMLVMDFLGEGEATMRSTLAFASEALRTHASATNIETALVR